MEANTINNVELNRRKTLAMIGSGLAVGGGVVGSASAESCGIPDDNENVDERSYKLELHDSDSKVDTYNYSGYENYGLETRGSLVYFGSEYNHDIGKWIHTFAAGSHVSTMKKQDSESNSEYSKHRDLVAHGLTIQNDDTSIASLFTTNNNNEVGCYPYDTDSPDDIGWDTTAFSVAISLLSIPVGGPLFTVGTTAVSAVLSLAGSEKSDFSSGEKSYSWDYSDQQLACEAVHMSEFILMSADGYSEASVQTTHSGVKDSGGIPAETSFWINVDGEDDPGCVDGICPSSLSEGESRPKPGSDKYVQYLEESDIAEKIDPKKSNISRAIPDSVDQDGPVYRAKNPTVRGGVVSESE